MKRARGSSRTQVKTKQNTRKKRQRDSGQDAGTGRQTGGGTLPPDALDVSLPRAVEATIARDLPTVAEAQTKRRRTRQENVRLGQDREVAQNAAEFVNQQVQALDPTRNTEEQVESILDRIEEGIDQRLKSWRDDFPEDRFNEMYAQFAIHVSNQLAAKGLDGYTIRHLGGEYRLLGPPPASTRGFSGSARADKLADLARWDGTRLPAAFLDSRVPKHLVRHTGLNYAVYSAETERRPGQSSAMGYVDHPTLNRLKGSGDVISPNAVRSTDIGEPRRSTEWLHMVARSDGNAVEFAIDIIPAAAQGMPTFDGFRRNRPQHPFNLIAGSYAANTLMMALERVGREASNKNEFTKDVKAWTTDDKNPHQAQVIEYTIQHTASGRSQTYFINATQDSYAPLPDYYHMEVDATRFFAADHSDPTLPKQSRFQYMNPQTVKDLFDTFDNSSDMKDAIDKLF